jgi:hypothetical protein
VAAPDETDASSSDWMTFYYTYPQPDRFVSEVRGMSKSAVLSKPSAEPPIVAFLSRVMAKNPEKVSAWMAALADLPDNDKETLNKAVWFSNTDAGKAYLKKHGLAKYLEKPAPDTLKMEIDSPSVLDMLWGCFFATGDDAPIRRIVSALNYGKYAGALERYKASKKTADLTVIKPDGKVYGEQKCVEVWQKKPAPQGKTLQLGVGQLGIVIEPNDPTGTYEIRAKVNDRVKGVVLELKRKFSVSK